jgi:HD domain
MRWHPESPDTALADLVRTAKDSGADESGAALIQHAYEIAERGHRGQRRLSGDAYITHPLAVAQILASVGAGPAALSAALLHDLPEDTGCTVAQLRIDVGAEVASLVDRVDRLDKAHYSSMSDAVDAIRAVDDDRVVLIKLADRLHNMRTLRYLTPAKQRRKSREALDAFAPLARALGMEPMARELADLAHSILAGPDAGPDRSHRAGQAPDPAVSRRLLAATAVLLPAAARERWLTDWAGELHSLVTRRSRARFTIAMITGMPRLAATLRWPASASPEGPQ